MIKRVVWCVDCEYFIFLLFSIIISIVKYVGITNNFKPGPHDDSYFRNSRYRDSSSQLSCTFDSARAALTIASTQQ